MEITENAEPPSSTPPTGLPTALSPAVQAGPSRQDYWTRMQELRDERAELQRSAAAC